MLAGWSEQVEIWLVKTIQGDITIQMKREPISNIPVYTSSTYIDVLTTFLELLYTLQYVFKNIYKAELGRANNQNYIKFHGDVQGMAENRTHSMVWGAADDTVIL